MDDKSVGNVSAIVVCMDSNGIVLSDLMTLQMVPLPITEMLTMLSNTVNSSSNGL